MQIDRTNKWGLGLLWGSAAPYTVTLRYRIFRSSSLVATTVLVCCVAFGEVIGIREPYLVIFRWITAILFLVALLPVVADLFEECRKRRFNPLSLLTALLLVGSAAAALLFPW